MLLYNAAPRTDLTYKTPAYNKNHKVIVKINGLDSARVIEIQTLEEITQSINDQLKRQNITQTCIRTAQVLKSGDIAIQVISNKEVQKLQYNHRWTTILGQKEFISRKTFDIIVCRVFIVKIDIKNLDISQS